MLLVSFIIMTLVWILPGVLLIILNQLLSRKYPV